MVQDTLASASNSIAAVDGLSRCSCHPTTAHVYFSFPTGIVTRALFKLFANDLVNSSISSTANAASAYPSYSAQKMQERDQVFSSSSKGHFRQDKPLNEHELSRDPTPTLIELSMNPHLNRLLGRDDNSRNSRQEFDVSDSVAAKHRDVDPPVRDGAISQYIPPPQFERGSATLLNPATATLSSSSSTQHHPLPLPDDSNSSPSQRIQDMTSPTFSTTSSYPSPPSFSALSPPLSSSDLQPYYPPPPTSTSTPSTATLTSTLQSTQGSHPIPPRPRNTPKDTLSTTTLTSGKLVSSPEPRGQRRRRHSSAAGSLTIDTNTLSSIKKGPNTANIDTRTMANTPSGITSNNSRYLEPDTITKGTARKLLKSIGGLKNQQQQQKQSPSHLAIPQQQSSLHARQQGIPGQMTRSQIQLQQYQQQQYQSQRSRSKREASPSSPNRTASSSSTLNTLQDRTAMAMMQRYLTNPDDPDSEADIAMQIMISQAAVDSKGFDILMPEAVHGIKRHHAGLSSRIAALTARLSLESKIREAAQSLLKLHAENKKLAKQASEHLEAANRKVDQVATELWKLTQVAADLQRTLLQHTSGVLALGVVRLEDQGRREREFHMAQLQETQFSRQAEEQFETMSKTIQDLESGALEAQLLLAEKDKAIERLVKQLEHQREMYRKMDEQQQRTLALSRSQQKLSQATSSSKEVELSGFLGLVGKRLQGILQLQQDQKPRQSIPQPKKRGSETTLGSMGSTAPTNVTQNDTSLSTLREDSMSSAPSEMTISGNVQSPSRVPTPTSVTVPQFSIQGITSTLDALDSHCTESSQKMLVLENELGLLRRQTIVMSESRSNSIRVKKSTSLPPPTPARQVAEDTIRAALENSLKDALLEKEMARQELENERQRWQDDQTHRINKLEESLVAVEEQEKKNDSKNGAGSMATAGSQSETIQELRRQLREAIEEIDVLSQQHQQSLKDMRQLFDMVPDHRRRNHMQMFKAHQVDSSSPGTPGRSASPSSGRGSPVGAVGFSMEALMVRVKELSAKSLQLEQDNAELKEHFKNNEAASKHRRDPSLPKPVQETTAGSTWILTSDLEKLQASASMIHLLEKELDLLKQHTDMLLDENARLAELAANSAMHSSSRLPGRGMMMDRSIVQNPTQDDTLDELKELIRVKDQLLRERDTLVLEQEKVIVKAREDLARIQPPTPTGTVNMKALAASSLSGGVAGPMSAFDVTALEEYRTRCGKMEEESAEMRLMLAALESMHGGPGSGARLLAEKSSSSPPSSWFSSSLGVVGSLSFGTLGGHNNNSNDSSQKNSFEGAHNMPGTSTPTHPPLHSANSNSSLDSFNANGTLGSNSSLSPNTTSNVVVGATAALRKEFRRVMNELRDEKEKSVRKEVEERRRLERVVRQLRRELQTVQNNMAPHPPTAIGM
ncbi:hypothetical protein CPC16_007309 [Podila verticillata]|nr:hypothetical protein CPC16_007309 [Podila verticillata]